VSSTLIGKQAVVVGAGMAGLAAARALADYFEHVVVLVFRSIQMIQPDLAVVPGLVPPCAGHPRKRQGDPAVRGQPGRARP
jgi:glycine/D-amino acid oxidase-like deaminating enzyme